MEIKNLNQGLKFHILKSYIEGVYADTPQNKKLGRVGMSYSSNGSNIDLNKENNKNIVITTPDIILEEAKNFLSNNSFNFLKNLLESKDFQEGDISLYNNKICFWSNIEINPEKNKDIINLGIDKESFPKEENAYYKFIRDTWSPKELEKKWLNTYEKEENWGIAKHYSKLSQLKIYYDIKKSIINGAKVDLWYEKLKKDILPPHSSYSNIDNDISDDEAERYVKIHGRKITKDQLADASKFDSLIKVLESNGIDFEDSSLEEMDKFKENFRNYILNSPRNEFYQVVKNIKSFSSIEDMIKLRFAFKYNKMLAGNGWSNILDKKGKIDVNKREDRKSVV